MQHTETKTCKNMFSTKIYSTCVLATNSKTMPNKNACNYVDILSQRPLADITTIYC